MPCFGTAHYRIARPSVFKPCHHAPKRRLAALSAKHQQYASANLAEFDQMTFQDLIRTADEQDLLPGDKAGWKQYRDIRSRTNHTDDHTDLTDALPESDLPWKVDLANRQRPSKAFRTEIAKHYMVQQEADKTNRLPENFRPPKH